MKQKSYHYILIGERKTVNNKHSKESEMEKKRITPLE